MEVGENFDDSDPHFPVRGVKGVDQFPNHQIAPGSFKSSGCLGLQIEVTMTEE